MNIQSNIPLVHLSSFHTQGMANELSIITTEQQIIDLLHKGKFQDRYYILWKGNNTLFNGNFQGLLIKNEIMGKEIISQDKEDILLKIGGWEDWVTFVKYCVENKYAGIENLSEIPWTVGASPIQNIGAYGTEVGEYIQKVEGINLTNWKKEIFSNEECQFWYRNSIFKTTLKNKFFITAVYFKLKKETTHYQVNIAYADIQNYIENHKIDKTTLSIKQVSEIITTIRQKKLPNLEERGTAGSFFKNPIITKEQYQKLLQNFPMLKSYPITDNTKVKVPSAQLIELVGMKGVLDDGVGTYKNHALILVSKGVQQGEKIVRFAEKIKTKVYETFAISLEAEVNIIGA